MSMPRQQPHAIARFKHQARTAIPKPVTVPAHMVPYDDRYEPEVDWWPNMERRLTESERKRHNARAARKGRK